MSIIKPNFNENSIYKEFARNCNVLANEKYSYKNNM